MSQSLDHLRGTQIDGVREREREGGERKGDREKEERGRLK